MNGILMASLLGVATFVLRVSTFEEHAEVSVSVSPPGSNIYLSECVLLRCTVKSRSAFVMTYEWYRSKQPTAPNPRHLVSTDRYYITGVTMEDADTYWCQAQYQHNGTRLKAPPVMLNVSGLLPPLLSLTPNTRHMLYGDNFTVMCPDSKAHPSSWKLLHFFPNHSENDASDFSSADCATEMTAKNESLCKRAVWITDVIVQDSPLSAASVSVVIAANRNGGLYWCENANGRSIAVNITLSYGPIILKTPPFSVFRGDTVVLYCRYHTVNPDKTTFFKNGEEINTYNSSILEGEIMMTIENVTQEDQGFYKCASQDRKMVSAESWLAVRSDRGKPGDGRPASSSGSWKWIIGSCGIVLLLVIPLTIWLVCHYRYQPFLPASLNCWLLCKQDVAAVALPATKQDVTEVQWDLSWMEMSSLLDKQLYPGT